jgi:hypothetical protein
MTHLSDYLEDAILDHITGTAALTSPTAWGSLHDGHPVETGANELTGGSYARQTIVFGSASGGTAANTAQEEWDLTGVTSGTVFFVGLWDAVTASNFLWSIPLGGTANTFTGEDTGDLFTSYGHGLANDNRLVLGASPGSALPAGLDEVTIYHVISITASTFQVSLTQGGGAVALTSDGEGISYFVDEKTFNNGDTFRIAIGDLDLFID